VSAAATALWLNFGTGDSLHAMFTTENGGATWSAVGAGEGPVVSLAFPGPFSASPTVKTFFVDTAGGNVVINLPSALTVPAGTSFNIVHTANANNINVTPFGVELLNGANALVAVGTTFGKMGVAISNGTSWWMGISN